MEKHGERSKMSWEWSLKFKTTQNREGKMKKLIKTSVSFFAVFALMITFSLQQVSAAEKIRWKVQSTFNTCLLYTSPSPRDRQKSRMPSSA